MSRAARRPWPLVVRRARPGDESAVMSFSTSTWNGWDYMPRAWPRWIDASDGVLLVGAVGGDGGSDAQGQPLETGSIVAVVRVALPAVGEAWLEGIRVDPRVRGMDVATDLQVAELHWAAANGATIVRYATGATNEGSHRLGARAGLEHVVSFLGASWGPDSDQQSGFERAAQEGAQRRRHALLRALADLGQVAGSQDAERIWRGVSGDSTFDAAGHLYEPRPWALEELTRRKFDEHVARGEVLHMSDDHGKAVAILVGDVPAAEDAAVRLSMVVGAPRTVFELVNLSARLNNDTFRFRYPQGAPIVEDMRAAYLEAGWELSDWAMHIMARPIDDGHPVPQVDPDALVMDELPRAVITPPR